MEGEKENTNFETPAHNASHNVAGKQEEIEKEACLPAGRELLSEKALEDDLELNEELDRLPI